MEQIRASSTPSSSAWARRPAAAAGRRRRRAQRRHRDGVPERPSTTAACATSASASSSSAAATRRSTSPPSPAASATSTRRSESDRPENAIAGKMAHDAVAGVAAPGRGSRADLGVRDRQDAGEQARGRACAGRGHRDRGGSRRWRGADASTAARRAAVARCEAKFVGGRLEIKIVPGTEEDIPPT